MYLHLSHHRARRAHYRIGPLRSLNSVLLFLACMFSHHLYAATSLQEIEICTIEWRPYTSSSMVGSGIAAQMITAVFNDMGYSPIFLFTSTQTCQDKAANNDANDGVRGGFPYFKTVDRQIRGLTFSAPLFDVEEVVFYNKIKHPELRELGSLQELANYTAAFVEGYAYDKDIQNTLTKRVSEDNEMEAFSNLLDGEVDLVPADYTVGIQILRRYFDRRQYAIGVLDRPKAKRSVYFMFSERNPNNGELLHQFNDSLGQIKKSNGFVYRIEALQHDRPQIVQLVDDAHVFVKARDIKHANTGYLLPRGTMGEVLHWPDALLKRQKWPISDLPDDCTKVQIVNGPQSGRQLCVDSRYITLSPN